MRDRQAEAAARAELGGLRLWFPSTPLIEALTDAGIPAYDHRLDRSDSITWRTVDRVCVEVLGVHPSEVYGDMWFEETVEMEAVA